MLSLMSKKESAARDYERHKDAYKARAKARYDKLKNNLDFKKANRMRLKKWEAENREHVNERANVRQRKYRASDPQHFRAKDQRKYQRVKASPVRYARLLETYRNNPKRKHYSNRYLARKKGAVGFHTFTQWMARVEYFGWACVYCGVELTEKTLTKDHFIPLAKGGTDFTSNLVPACKSCNCRKGGR